MQNKYTTTRYNKVDLIVKGVIYALIVHYHKAQLSGFHYVGFTLLCFVVMYLLCTMSILSIFLIINDGSFRYFIFLSVMNDNRLDAFKVC
jgi:hypothetical protein